MLLCCKCCVATTSKIDLFRFTFNFSSLSVCRCWMLNIRKNIHINYGFYIVDVGILRNKNGIKHICFDGILAGRYVSLLLCLCVCVCKSMF